MIALAIDTATTDLVVGLVNAETGAALSQSVIPTRSHNELLVPTITQLLGEAGLSFNDLDAVVVGCGPGPFTGLRVGMATASAIGQALSIPVHGVCTHDAVVTQLGEGRVAVFTDARRREVYWCLYEDGVRSDGPSVTAPANLNLPRVDVLSVPEHLREQVAERVQAAEITYAAPSPAGLVAAADLGETPGPLVPLYLRRPDAAVPAARPPSPAIPRIDLENLDG